MKKLLSSVLLLVAVASLFCGCSSAPRFGNWYRRDKDARCREAHMPDGASHLECIIELRGASVTP